MTTQIFSIVIDNQPVRVTYTPSWFAGLVEDRYAAQDHFAFESPYTPRRRTPISETGYYSYFAHSQAVEAWGCPEDYALKLGLLLAGKETGEDETPVQGSLF